MCFRCGSGISLHFLLLTCGTDLAGLLLLASYLNRVAVVLPALDWISPFDLFLAVLLNHALHLLPAQRLDLAVASLQAFTLDLAARLLPAWFSDLTVFLLLGPLFRSRLYLVPRVRFGSRV